MSDSQPPGQGPSRVPLPPSPPTAYNAPQYAPPPGYPTPGYPPSRPNSGLAVTSLVCGIAGLVLVWALIPLLASIAAVITGHLALTQIRRNPMLGGRGMAIAGLILGYAGVAFLIIGILIGVASLLFLGAFTMPFIVAG